MWMSSKFPEIYAVKLQDFQFWTPTITVHPIRATIPCLNQYLDLGEKKENKVALMKVRQGESLAEVKTKNQVMKDMWR